MVYSMITGDMLTFGIIYMVMLFGFSQSFHFLYKGYPRVQSSLYHSYHSTWMALFQITLGDYSVRIQLYFLFFFLFPSLCHFLYCFFIYFVFFFFFYVYICCRQIYHLPKYYQCFFTSTNIIIKFLSTQRFKIKYFEIFCKHFFTICNIHKE